MDNLQIWADAQPITRRPAQGRGMIVRGKLGHFEEADDFKMPRHTRSLGPRRDQRFAGIADAETLSEIGVMSAPIQGAEKYFEGLIKKVC